MTDHTSSANENLTKEELAELFRQADVQIPPHLFDLVFSIFDLDGDGTVDRHEFTVSMAMLLSPDTDASSAADGNGVKASNPDDKNDDNNDDNSSCCQGTMSLAFNLFDADGGGTISAEEFNRMYATLVGTQLSHLLTMQVSK
jgi:Ca2+-binding EF-hand superfamily protein